jgi:hypothetical protein
MNVKVVIPISGTYYVSIVVMYYEDNITATLFYNDHPTMSIISEQRKEGIVFSRERATLLTNVRQNSALYVRLLSGQLNVDQRHANSFAGFLLYPT